jgi:acetolactate synthase small subunit
MSMMSETLPAVATEEIAKLRGGIWVQYTRAQQILEQLEDLYNAPRVHRMPNLLIVGETNNGKTMIARRFLERHRPDIHIPGETSAVPILLVQAPSAPDESRFYNAILTDLYAPFRPSARADQKLLQVLRLLDAVGIRVLIIDEIHHVLAGTAAKQRSFLNMIKYLGNELQVPIVGIGTRDAFNAIHSDPQLANRFLPALLPKWKLDQDYARLLASFERRLRLPEGMLVIEGVAAKILALSEGTIGEIADLVARVVSQAVKKGHLEIDVTAVEDTGYIPPSLRRRPPELA